MVCERYLFIALWISREKNRLLIENKTINRQSKVVDQNAEITKWNLRQSLACEPQSLGSKRNSRVSMPLSKDVNILSRER